ncbi:MAG: hypothetical protein KDD68_19530 [Bdellovibrionales bacterium]|nr:hypothetical protein [Bdellovibrionales bacterium]
MSEPSAIREYDFHPDWDHLERFLQLYQELHKSQKRHTLKVLVTSDFYSTLPGYPNRQRNSWMTLDYATQQMNRSFSRDQSLVDCLVALKEGKS